MEKIGIILSLFFLFFCGCVSFVEKKVFDFDRDGIVDKKISYASSRLLTESFDRNKDGVMDVFLYYDKKNNLYMREYDEDGDTRVDMREEIFSDQLTKISTDANSDGFMDWSYLLHSADDGEAILVEIDWDMNHTVDSKIDVLAQLRQDRVHGKWYQSFEKEGQRCIYVHSRFLPIVFSKEGEWIVTPRDCL